METSDAFFRFDQRVPEPLMVALSMIKMDELGDGSAQRLLTEEDHLYREPTALVVREAKLPPARALRTLFSSSK